MSVSNQQRDRRGGVSWPLVIIVGSLVLLVGLFTVLSPRKFTPTNSAATSTPGNRAAGQSSVEPLVVYCAASNRAVIESVQKDYEAEFGIEVQVQYGASQSLLASIEVTKSGDLYLPADDSFLVTARKRQLLDAEFPLAEMSAVVAVPKGNPRGITKLDDLLQDGVRLAQGNTESTAIGVVTRQALTAAGQWDRVEQQTTVFKTTVNDVANDVKVGAVDAGIVYDAVLHTYETLEAVAIPELRSVTSKVVAATLATSSQPQQARRFARYLSARDKGLKRYAEFGFRPLDGDPWVEQPELTLYAGSMLRPAIEATITDFEQREGAKVTRVYNGCGILVGQMKAGSIPDAYFACDAEFMTQVHDLFPESQAVSQNELVILVKKGNPFGIGSLKDLTKPDLRVGIGHEKQCAMGWLTQKTFAESGLQTSLMKNVVVQTPTGDMLVNQMRSGSLDAAVVYLSNAAGAAETLDAVRITGLPCSIATQPYAIAKDSPHKRLGERLLQAIRDEASHARFTAEGFRWLDEQVVQP